MKNDQKNNKLKYKNYTMLALIVFFIVMMFLLTMVKMGALHT